jgi:hypothetical protein
MKKLGLLAGLLGLAACIFVPTLLKNHGIYLFTYWLIYVIATMGLNLTIGYAGQKSLGHAAFFGIGAYTVAILMQAGYSFWLGMPLAALVCFVVGLALGFPALRHQGAMWQPAVLALVALGHAQAPHGVGIANCLPVVCHWPGPAGFIRTRLGRRVCRYSQPGRGRHCNLGARHDDAHRARSHRAPGTSRAH